MSPWAYLTFEAVVDPVSENDLIRITFLDPVSRAHSPKERVFKLNSTGTPFTTFGLMSRVATTLGMMSHKGVWMRCTSGHFLGTVNTTQAIVYRRSGSVPLSGPKKGIPRIKCPVFSVRVPQESFRAKNVRVWIEPFVSGHHP